MLFYSLAELIQVDKHKKKKMHIPLILSDLVVFKTLCLNHHIYDLHTKFAKILEICKQFSENLADEPGIIPRRGPVPKFSNLVVAAYYSK